MSALPGHVWWVVGLLALLKIGVLAALYQSRRTIKLLKEKERKARALSGRLLIAVRNLQEERERLAKREKDLLRQIDALTLASRNKLT